ncbi:MAG TPA: hypothetical protein VM571_01140 [Noviherbaspirillum sp.]|nr:hypothetical protein [Noviherbaspirillum sp.]
MTLRSLLAILWFTAFHANAELPLHQLPSGLYGESLELAINPSEKTVSGFFESEGGYNPQTDRMTWRCSFYFSGKIKTDGDSDIVAVAVGLMNKGIFSKGTLTTAETPTPAVMLKLERILPGCSRGEDFLSENPPTIFFSERKKWIEFRMVSTRQSYFYKTPFVQNQTKAYVTCGDIVVVMDKEPKSDRVQVDYQGLKRATSGWIRQADLLNIGETPACRR